MSNVFNRFIFGVSLATLSIAGGSVRADSFDEMISPVTNPYNFEDPRSMTELRPVYIFHKLDNEFITQGGDVRIWALQARFALDDRFSIIATKDGFIDFNPDAVLSDDEGAADIAAGLKYAFYKDDAAKQIGTFGFRYEIPIGNEDVLQGQGDGMFNPFVSGAMKLGPVNVMAATGFRFRVDDSDSSFYDFDLHVDTPVTEWFYPLLELNVVNVIQAGDRLPIADEGQDAFNFGASESDGKTMVTGGVGARVRLCNKVDWGVAYQFPLATGEGTHVTDWRITTDMIFHFGYLL